MEDNKKILKLRRMLGDLLYTDNYIKCSNETLDSLILETKKNERERILEIVENIDYYNSKNVMVDIINKIKELK